MNPANIRAGAAAAEIRAGAVLYRALEDGRELVVYPMLPGQHRLTIGDQGSQIYADAWCYPNVVYTAEALVMWDGQGDPPGPWFRHIGSGRRRRFNEIGDVVEEYVLR